MIILLVASAFNSLTQRVSVELADRGHTVPVQLSCREEDLHEALHRHDPALIIAPMLRTAIPESVWRARTCLIVHPGPPGDRGPSSLDRAVREGVDRWGVTVLQANGEMDAGAVWASASFPVPPVGKSDLYRNEVSDAALEAVLLAVDRFASGTFRPAAQSGPGQRTTVRTRPFLRQEQRRIDWTADRTGTVLRELRAADSQPGVPDELLGGQWFLHGGHREPTLTGTPGEVLATRAGAICRATVDGAVWIPQLRPRRLPGQPPTFTLPATVALGGLLPAVPDLPLPLDPQWDGPGWTDIRYRETGEVGFLRFSFPGGAMGTAQCERLLAAYRYACARPTSVLVLGGARDFFGNGIHLNVIEAAADPGAESWANLNAIDDLVEAVLTTTDRLVVAALGGNAAAGGVMLALAADEVWCRTGVVLNPHYRLMGLYGSEYWTYSLPRRVGARAAERLTERALPVSAASGHRLGLVDRLIESSAQDFTDQVAGLAVRLSAMSSTRSRIAAKKTERERAESVKPLAAHRDEELARMRRIFDDPTHPYHALRRAFVRKEPPPVAGRPAASPDGASQNARS